MPWIDHSKILCRQTNSLFFSGIQNFFVMRRPDVSSLFPSIDCGRITEVERLGHSGSPTKL